MLVLVEVVVVVLMVLLVPVEVVQVLVLLVPQEGIRSGVMPDDGGESWVLYSPTTLLLLFLIFTTLYFVDDSILHP